MRRARVHAIFPCDNIAVKLPRLASKVRFFSLRLYPQSADRRISHCPNFRHFRHGSSLFHHQRRASHICSNSSDRLFPTLLRAISIPSLSHSNFWAFFRCCFNQSRCAFSGSSQPTTEISFPSTTIVPAIFGLRERLRAVPSRLLFRFHFAANFALHFKQILNGGEGR